MSMGKDLFTIDVSGHIFELSRDNLTKSELFQNVLTDCLIDNVITIKRSAKLFNYVHAYLVDPTFPYPRKYYKELDYYGIAYINENLYDPKANLLVEIESLKSKLVSLETQICRLKNPISPHHPVEDTPSMFIRFGLYVLRALPFPSANIVIDLLVYVRNILE